MIRSFFLLFCVATVLRANPVALTPLRAALDGETVSVLLLKAAANVTAIYEFNTGSSVRPRRIYFPIFADADDDPTKVLLRSGLEFAIDGQTVAVPLPCAAPLEVPNLPAGVHTFWFAAEIEWDLDASALPPSFRVKANYVQPLIKGQFLYLPLISGYEMVQSARSWRYQLHAYTPSRMPQVTSPSDYEPLGRIVTVYLKNGELVQLQ